jgi:hypothetical protein
VVDLEADVYTALVEEDYLVNFVKLVIDYFGFEFLPRFKRRQQFLHKATVRVIFPRENRRLVYVIDVWKREGGLVRLQEIEEQEFHKHRALDVVRELNEQIKVLGFSEGGQTVRSPSVIEMDLYTIFQVHWHVFLTVEVS